MDVLVRRLGRCLAVALAVAAVIWGLSLSRQRVLAPEENYTTILAAVEEAAASHSESVLFDDKGADEEVVRSVLSDGVPGSDIGTYGKRRTKTLLTFDRYAIDASSCSYRCVKTSSTSRVTSISLSYFLNEKQVAQADKTASKVARKAAKADSDTEKIKVVHDWIVRNTAYGNAKSEKWRDASAYGVSRDTAYGCSGGLILSHRGKCNSYTLTLLRICADAGITDMRYVGCLTGKGDTADHAVAVYAKSKKHLYIDCTWDDPVFFDSDDDDVGEEDCDKTSHKFLLISSSKMRATGHVLSL